MTFNTFLERFHAASGRKVLTNDELRAAHADGFDPADVAAANDRLAAEYDAVLAEEEASCGS